jgi:hypothetical protein
MTTYVIMQNRISDEAASVSAASSSLYETQIQRSILSAVAHYARERFYFNTKTNTFSTVADQEYYSSSDFSDLANLVEIHGMTVTHGSTKLPLKSMDFQPINDGQSGSVKGLPRYYAYYKQNLRLYPIPDAVYTMTVAYLYKLTALSASSDSNAWTTDAEELIRNRAKADLRCNVMKVDDAIGERRELGRAGKPFYSYDEESAYRALKRETRLRMNNGILRIDEALVAPRGYNISYE